MSEQEIYEFRSGRLKRTLENQGWCPDCGAYGTRPWEREMPPCGECGSAAFPLRAGDISRALRRLVENQVEVAALQDEVDVHIQAREKAERRVYELTQALAGRGPTPEELREQGEGQSVQAEMMRRTQATLEEMQVCREEQSAQEVDRA